MRSTAKNFTLKSYLAMMLLLSIVGIILGGYRITKAQENESNTNKLYFPLIQNNMTIAQNWHTYTSDEFGYSIQYPSEFSPHETRDVSDAPSGVPSELWLGEQIHIITRIPALPDDTFATMWANAPMVKLKSGLLAYRQEFKSSPEGPYESVTNIGYAIRAIGADYFITFIQLKSASSDTEQKLHLLEAMIETFATRKRTYSPPINAASAQIVDGFEVPFSFQGLFADYNVYNTSLNRPEDCGRDWNGIIKCLSELKHAGEDWIKGAGQDVHAVADGTVIYAAFANYPGDVVIIKHTLPANILNTWGTNEIYSMYGHIDHSVISGVNVKRGDLIGKIYNQGSNSHLHFEIRGYGNMNDAPEFMDGIYFKRSPEGPGYTNTGSDPWKWRYIDPSDWIKNHSPAVTLYDQPNYNTNGTVYTVSKQEDLAAPIDKHTSSISIPSGWSVKVYRNHNFDANGGVLIFNQSVANLADYGFSTELACTPADNAISSIEVFDHQTAIAGAADAARGSLAPNAIFCGSPPTSIPTPTPPNPTATPIPGATATKTATQGPPTATFTPAATSTPTKQPGRTPTAYPLQVVARFEQNYKEPPAGYVYAGDTVIIQYTGNDKWSIGEPILYGPGGEPGRYLECGAIMPSAYAGALVAYIADNVNAVGQAVNIGPGPTQFTVQQGGRLILAINDCKGLGADNQGAIWTLVDIIPPGGQFPTATATPLVWPGPISERELEVFASSEANDTGYTVSAGQNIDIQYLRGQWSTEEQNDFGPNGQPNGHVPGCRDTAIMKDEIKGKLIVSIGDDSHNRRQSLPTGSHLLFTASASGKLMLHLNGCYSEYYKYHGSLVVHIGVFAPGGHYPPPTAIPTATYTPMPPTAPPTNTNVPTPTATPTKTSVPTATATPIIPPDTPVLTAPDEGHQFLAGASVTVLWRAANRATYYHYVVYNFNSSNAVVDQNTTATQVMLPGLADGQYTIIVESHNDWGQWSGWTERRFAVGDPTPVAPPTNPIITAPTENQTFEPGQIITVIWTESMNSWQYHLAIHNVTTDEDSDRWLIVPYHTIDLSDLTSGTYEVRVQAYGQSGTLSQWSPWVHFIVSEAATATTTSTPPATITPSAAPDAPVIVCPTNNGASLFAPGSDIPFNWAAVNRAVQYHVAIYNFTNGNFAVDIRTTTPAYLFKSTTEGSYDIVAEAYDQYGTWSLWSNHCAFDIGNPTPTATFMPTASMTPTAQATDTPQPGATATNTPIATPIPATPTLLASDTATRTPSPTPTSTNTQIPPSTSTTTPPPSPTPTDTITSGKDDDLFGVNNELWIDPIAPFVQGNANIGLNVQRKGGKKVLDQIIVRFYLGDPKTNGVLLGEASVPFLAPGESAETSTVVWQPATAGDYILYAVIDPENTVVESDEQNNIITHAVRVNPRHADELAPHVDNFTINDGIDNTFTRTVALNATVSDPTPSSGLKGVYYIEYAYQASKKVWTPMHESGWLPYTTGHSNQPWILQPDTGIKYIYTWAADNDGNISLAPYKATINYLAPSMHIQQGETHILRYHLAANQHLVARLQSLTGDADLYVWSPDYQTRPPWVSNLSKNEDAVMINAPIAGGYQVEVRGYSDGDYVLDVQVTTPVASASETMLTSGTDPSKPLFNSPLLAPSNKPSEHMTPPPVDLPHTNRLYLPIIQR